MGGHFENIVRDFAAGGDIRPAAQRHAAHNLPRVQPITAEQDGSLPKRYVQAGWRGLALLALLSFGGRLA